jgi:ABC-type uncharacterized transport system substrate-binding protein
MVPHAPQRFALPKAGPMIRSIYRLLLSTAAALTVAGATEAFAHPHVWVTVKSELVYAPDGTVTAVRHHWAFDEMFSTFATQGLDTDKDGKLSREELAGLAEINVTSLKEFDYFTHAKGDGKKSTFKDAADYWLEQKDGGITLHFTLALQAPVKAKSLEIDVYDPTYFVDFAMAKSEAVALVNAPAQCKLAAAGRNDAAATPAQPLNESFFNQLDASSNFGSRFANKISVSCP